MWVTLNQCGSKINECCVLEMWFHTSLRLEIVSFSALQQKNAI